MYDFIIQILFVFLDASKVYIYMFDESLVTLVYKLIFQFNYIFEYDQLYCKYQKDNQFQLYAKRPQNMIHWFMSEKNNWCHFSIKQEKRLYPLSRLINGKLCKLVSSFLVAIILKSRLLAPQFTKPIRSFIDNAISTY